MFGVQRNWHIRAVAIGGVILIHVVVIISIGQHRAQQDAREGAPAYLTPIISEHEETPGGTLRTERSRDDEAMADSRWKFEPFETWPSRVKAAPGIELSSFTGRSAVPLHPIEPPPETQKHRIPTTSTLRLRRWVRPDYSTESANAGEQGVAQLEVHVDESGMPLEINLLRGTGFSDLDQSALHAAHAWIFSPPLDHSRPVRTWAEIEIRFQAQ